MLKHILIVLFLFGAGCLPAQYEYREYQLNDSTIHGYNADSSVIAGRTSLYWATSVGLTQIMDFATPDPNEYIRDFEMVTDSLWYVIVGSRYLGWNASLFTSTDLGLNWAVDTSYYAATKPAVIQGAISNSDGLYQLQVLSKDTLLLFVSYYQSGIFYSIDGGQNWQAWFANLIENYRGIFQCDSLSYLWGLEGDGFKAAMFAFPNQVLLSPDTNNAWANWAGIYHPACYNSADPLHCIYAPSSIPRYEQFLYFHSYVDSLCENQPTAVRPIPKSNIEGHIYPNPSPSGVFTVDLGDAKPIGGQYRVCSVHGSPLTPKTQIDGSSFPLDLSSFGPGIYLLELSTDQGRLVKKLVW